MVLVPREPGKLGETSSSELLGPRAPPPADEREARKQVGDKKCGLRRVLRAGCPVSAES